MKLSPILLLLLVFSGGLSQSKRPNSSDSSVVLRGEDYAFAISVPGNWVIDTGQAFWSRYKAILHPKDSRARKVQNGNPDAWITIGLATKRIEGKQTLKNLLTYFAKQDSFWKAPRTVSDAPNLITKDKKTVLVRHDNSSDRHLATAYIDDETIVTVIQIWRFTEADFNEALPKLTQIVESYESVSINKKHEK